MDITRRSLLQVAGITAAALPFAQLPGAFAQNLALTIAYPVDVPSWDPIAHTFQLAMPIFRSVFDSPLDFTADLKLAPNVITAWKFDGDKAIDVTFRDDVIFHNGDPLTADDFRFSFFERQKADPKLPTAAIWRKIQDIEVQSTTKAVIKLSAPMPTAPQWLAFLGSFILPMKYFTSVGREGFLEKPIGSGPYRLVEYQRDARIVLEANDKYWGPKPSIPRVTFQVVKDPTARVAAVEAGQVDVTSQIPIRETIRLGKVPGLTARTDPFTDIIIIQIANAGAFTDMNVRLAAHHAIDKAAISKALFNGAAKPISILAPPGTPGDVPGFSFPYSQDEAKSYLAKSGFSKDKPVKIKFNTTNGSFPNDFEVARAIVQMWKNVGIEAELGVIELAQYYELEHNNKMPEATLYRWSNDTADPELYTGFILNPKLQFSSWKTEDVGAKLEPLLSETDYDKRVAGYHELNRYVVEKGYTIPLFQGVTTVAYHDGITYTPRANGWLLPAALTKKV